MSSDLTRRRLLLGLGTGLTVGLAGCSDGTGGGNGTNTTTDAGADTTTTTAMTTEMPAGMTTETATETATETTAEAQKEEQTRTQTQEQTTATPQETALLRVVHLSPNAPNVDVYADGSVVLEDVSFGTVSDYLSVPAGDRELEITAAGDSDTVVFSGTVPVMAETSYTVAAIGETGQNADQSFEPLVLEDNNSNPGSDAARVRLVHASPDAPAVDVTLASNGNVLYNGISYGDSGYIEVPPGEYTLQVRGDTENNDGDVVGEFDVSVSGGQVYTAFASGYLTPDDEPASEPFDLIFVQDTDGMSG